MRATARRENGKLQNAVEIGSTPDRGRAQGPRRRGRWASPQELLAASLASCTAITMEMYAQPRAGTSARVTVDVDYEPAQRGSPRAFSMVVNFPKELPEDQRERLMQIGANAPCTGCSRARSCSRSRSSSSDQEPARAPTSGSARASGSPAARRPRSPWRWRRAWRSPCRARGRRPARGRAGSQMPRPRASGTTATHSTSELPSWSVVSRQPTGSPRRSRRRRGRVAGPPRQHARERVGAERVRAVVQRADHGEVAVGRPVGEGVGRRALDAVEVVHHRRGLRVQHVAALLEEAGGLLVARPHPHGPVGADLVGRGDPVVGRPEAIRVPVARRSPRRAPAPGRPPQARRRSRSCAPSDEPPQTP